MLRAIIIISVLLICVPVNAELNLKPVHPDEPVDYTYNKRFSVQSAIGSLKKINSALDSFRKLTEASKGTISKTKMRKIGNTGWETQNLGFMNWPGSIEGTIYKQEYLIKKLNYELTLEKAKSGKLNSSDLTNVEKELQQAEKKFQDYWNSFGIGD